MKDKNPIAEYPFTQAQLWQRCLDLQPSLSRDTTELAKRGVTAGRLTKFRLDTAAFGDMSPDTVVVQEGAAVTDEKDAVVQDLETSMQAAMSIIMLKDDPRTPRYKRFGVSDVSSLGEAKLHLAATMLVRQGRKYLEEYKDEGLTAAMLDAVEQHNEAFLEGLMSRKEAENTRSGATRARILFANGLYRQLVQLCAAGESVWKLTDATRAREYVVDPIGPATPKPAVAG
ncbi:hypothetical protein [Hymenobacter algoricola]|uniref:Uncharacterized protein n=1 Tax=Hymenobacter algoricola TaxID=486267 RepID=A0ABP7NRK9_9BACT